MQLLKRSDTKPAAPAVVGGEKVKLKGTLMARGLSKSYKGRRVVNGVSLGVRAGEAVGLLGPNGAGKTTCFYMVTGLVPVDEGTIEIDGFDVTSMPMYRRARLGIDAGLPLSGLGAMRHRCQKHPAMTAQFIVGDPAITNRSVVEMWAWP